MVSRTRWSAALLCLAIFACKSGPSGVPEPGPAGGGDPAVVAPVAAPAAAPPKEVTTVEGITEYALANGMKVLLFPDDSKETVTVNLTVFVGSRHEGYGETGMAHLLEHMLFKGTPTTPDIWKALEDHGASFNGTTWTDRTNYFETLPATWENLEWAVSMEADRMVNSDIDPAKLATEFSVVRNEFEMGENNPAMVLEERMYSTAYLWHNYGKSTIGSRSDIERVPVENLRAFYEKFYQPDNAMLVVAGKFDQAKTLELVNRTFGAIPRPGRKLQPTYTVEPVQDGEREVILRRVGDVAVVGLVYHTVPGSHEDFVPTEALVHMLTDEPSGRLYKALVESGMATKVWGSAYPWAEPGALQVFAEVRLDKPLQPVRDKMIAIAEGFDKTPVTEAEVRRYRAEMLKELKLALANSQRIAIELSESAALGDWRLIFIYRDRVEKVAVEAVQRVAGLYLKSANRTVGMFIPTKDPQRSPLPAQPDVASLVTGYKGRDAVSAGENFVATIENIEKRTTRTALSGGMKLALLPKETRGDVVRFTIALHFGNLKELKGKGQAAELVAPMLMRGTKRLSYQEIQDELDRLEAKVSISSEGADATVNVVTVRGNLLEVVGLVGELLREPTFPKEQFELLRKEQLSELEQALSDPQTLIFTAITRALMPYPADDVRYNATIPEKIERLKKAKVEDVKKFHQTFWGASNAELTVVGDFDPKELVPELEKRLGGWKSPRPYQRLETPKFTVAGSEDSIDTPDKEMAIIIAGLDLEIRDDDPEFPALQIVNYALGGSGASRLMNRLRQRDGLSYGAGSFMQADSLDRFGILIAYAILAPQNAAKGMAAMLEEFNLLVEKGIPEKELEDAKKNYLQEFDRNLTNDGFVMNALNEGLYLGRTMDFYAKLNEAVKKLGPADVDAVAKKFVKPAGLVRITAGDKKKAAETP